jgi:dolichyl-diphosphooligosaccharide--protein glycosyltransferase
MADTAALELVFLALAAGAGLGLAEALWRRAGTPRRRALLAAAALALAAGAAALFAVSRAGRKLVRYIVPGSIGVFPDAALQVQELTALAPPQVAARLGDWPLLALAAVGLAWLAARAPRPAGPLGALVLAAWALPAIVFGSQAMRFLVYGLPAVALAAGCALGAIAAAVVGPGRRGAAPDACAAGASEDARAPAWRAAARAAIAAAAALVLAWTWWPRLAGFQSRRPAADLALAEAAAAIADRAPADALVYAWWDHGHALAALADRGVVLDGATFQTQRLYWLALALTTHDETLAANALRLIGCDGEEALHAELVHAGLPPARAVDRLRRALRQPDAERAADYLERTGVPGSAVEQARRLLGCRPPPSWLVVTGDLTAKTTSWSWFGSWRFDRANPRPGPRMSAPVRCALSVGGRLECADGTAADLARDGFEDRSTPGHFAAAGPPRADRLAPVLHQHGDELLLTRVRPWLVDSLFSRLYFFNGRGLERFRLEGVFHHPPHTQRVLVYRIVWDGAEGGGGH